MDNRKINRKTFTYFDKVDEFELSEIINLLCQYSLVNERNECLEIHSLVQKVIRYRIEQKQFVKGECPLTLLEDVLVKIQKSPEEFITKLDFEDLWYIHAVHLIFSCVLMEIKFDIISLLNVANERFEIENMYNLSKVFSLAYIKQYRSTRDINTFNTLLVIHTNYMNAANEKGIFDMNQITGFRDQVDSFEKEFSSELEQKVEEAYDWKLQKAKIYNLFGHMSLYCSITDNLYKELINEKGFDNVKLQLVRHLNVNKSGALLNSIDEKNVCEKDFSEYYSAKYSFYIAKRLFDLADQVMKKWKEHLQNTPFARINHVNFSTKRIFLLYKKGHYREALLACDEHERKFDHVDTRVSLANRALILLKIEKFDETEALLSDCSQYNNFVSEIIAYLKFRKNDFKEVEELLTNDNHERVQNILFLVKEYANLHRDFKNNKSKELIEKCLQMKRYINNLFQKHFDLIGY